MLSLANFASKSKKNLQARKEKILQDIKYYEKRIEDFHATASLSSNYYFENSSDSEDDFYVAIDNGPSISQLKIIQSQLETCLQATNELTSLQVAQSEVTMLVEDPDLEGEPPVTEPGSWRQVTAVCRIDMVPFFIQFKIHLANRSFGPKSYRCLKISICKATHEIELSNSILTKVKKPSDAIEVLRSYAIAFRSRRTTLIKLAEEYGNHLLMEPGTEGGFILKCANLLEMSWCLENKWSSLAPFHHSLKFDLEYMDESYIKIISQAHKQLSDPAIETDQRTLLLAMIIDTCLEAQGIDKELNTSIESEKSIKIPEKRTTTKNISDTQPLSKKKRDKTIDLDRNERDRVDDEIMAPPKSLPKKMKPKGKENTDQNRKSLKRSNAGEVVRINKKIRTEIDIRQLVDELDEAKRLEGIDNLAQNEDNLAQNEDNLAQNEDNLAQNEDNLAQNEATEVGNGSNAKTKIKSSLNQKNPSKEQVKNVKKTKDMKQLKNGNPVNKMTEQKTAKNELTAKSSNTQGNVKKCKEAQEKIKNTHSQKVTGNNKNVASAKNDPKSKEALKKLSKDKIASTNNNPQTKNLESATVSKSDNNVASPKIIENNSKKTTVKAKNMAKNIPGDTDQPEISETNDKISTNDNNDKAVNQKVDTKENISKKGVESSKKIQINTKLADPNKKATNTGDKVKIISNVLVASAKTENLPKGTKLSVADAKNSKETIKDLNDKFQKNNTQKPKTQVNSTKNSNNAIKQKILQKNINANVKTVDNNTQKEVTEQNHKMKNVAISTKEHIADRTDGSNKKSDSKNEPSNTNNKIPIKNLTHKNFAQKKLPKSSSNINVKTGNTANNLNTSNTKRNDVPAKKSKIPQKRLTPSKKISKKNPLRISPRKIALSFKYASDSNLKQKIQLKHGTNIPRIMKKPEQRFK